MARYQNGSVRTEERSDGPTWVYPLLTSRGSMENGSNTRHRLGLVERISVRKRRTHGREVDHQRFRENINKTQPFRGKPNLTASSLSTMWSTSCRKTNRKRPSRRRIQPQKLISGFLQIG